MFKNIIIAVLSCALIVVGLFALLSPKRQSQVSAEQVSVSTVKTDEVEMQSNDQSENSPESATGHASQQLQLTQSNKASDSASYSRSDKVAEARNRLCVDASTKCEIKDNIAIEAELIDQSSQLAKAQEVGILLASSNFDEVVQALAATKVSNEFIDLQDELNQQVFYDYDGIATQGVFCSDRLCAASITYQEQASWEHFQKDFFSKNKGLGNLFIAHFNNETRVLFLPSDKSEAVIR